MQFMFLLWIVLGVVTSSCATRPDSSRLPAREAEIQLNQGGGDAEKFVNSLADSTAKPPSPPKFLMASIANRNELIELSAFAVSYSRSTGLAEWVSYCMDDEMAAAESVERSDHFRIYPEIQSEAHHPKWYKRSGYDRGHLAPAGDFRHSELAMEETFYMINIAPQAPRLNRGLWRSLESRIRELTSRADFVCVFTGPVLDKAGSALSKGGAIPIPSAFFKVIYAQKGGQHLGIGFLVPNRNDVVDLDNYDLPVRKLERVLQIDFFVEMTSELQDDIELDRDPGFLLNPVGEN